MRYLKYIILSLLTSILTLSCVKELEDPTPIQQNAALTLVPRVKSFSNQYVTKAYTSEEAKITRLAILVFDENGNLIHLQEGSDDAGINSLPLNKSILNKPSATVVMFANVNLSNIRNASGKSILDNQSGLKISDLPGYAFHFDSDKTVITDLGSSFKGFPMAGIRENVNLSPTATQQGAVDISLQILYAKVNFSIGVENGNENTGTGMQFAMTGYSIHNVSTQMSLTAPEGATDESAMYSYADTTGKAVNKSGTVALDGTPLTFTFYVAESRYEHNSDLKGIYPSNDWLTSVQEEDVKNYDSATDEAKLNGVKYFYDDLIQQYKPKLADLASGKPGKGKATYVLLKGTYTDYRGTVWTVNYKVYLGKDNALNFHVDRNSEYTNYITIKGIRNNDGFGDEDVWLDHRVTNVSTTDPSGYISITRETLIDAHIEVRPLRVQWEEGKYAGVRVYLPTKDGTLVNWIGIERFTGANCQDSATYCYADGESTGKRRYFTTDLISELQTKEGEFGVQTDTDENKFIYLLNGECAWIYFDEHVSFKSYPTQPSSARDAVIKLEFFGDDGNKKAEEIYNVKQLGLQRRGGYNVESYEEYLHSYDSADKYNLSTTPADYTQQGLSWGLENKVVSQDIIVSRATIDSDIIKDLADSWFPDAKYDFFADSDTALFNGDNFYRYMKENGVWSSKSGDKETGLGFTNRATKNKIITVKDMGSAPENAYQYCLSKNKFEVDDDGNVKMVLNWYLPDVHQLAKVLNATAEGSSDFRSDDFYWSSQPSFTAENTYEWGTTSIGLLDEVPENARARSKGGNPKDFPRSSKNRIRCLYTQNGQEADMTGRTPDGIGGLTSIVMNGLAADGYFNYYVKNLVATDDDTIITDEHPEITYPTEDNSNESGPEFKYVTITDKSGKQQEGFTVNPQENWKEHVIEFGNIFGYEIKYETGYYTTLATYPGLTEMTLDKMGESIFDQKRKIGTIEYTYREIAELLNINIDNLLVIDAYKPTTTPKSRLLTKLSTKSRKLNKGLPSSTDLLYLDHVKGGKKFSINFAKNSGASDPIYVYDETTSGTKTDTTYKWEKPVYTGTPHQLADERSQSPITASGDGSEVNTNVTRDQNTARSNAESRARDEAKTNALNNLKNVLSNYPGWEYDGDPTITYSTSKYSNERKVLGFWTTTCSVTATASVYLKKGGTQTLFLKTSGGKWTPTKSSYNEVKLTINSDQLRMYCGNSFTISLSDETDEDKVKYSEGYEITKIKVHYSGNNLIKKANGFYGIGEDEYYARLVDSTIDLTKYSQTISKYGGGEVTLQLPGMEYVENSDNTSGTHQWSGEGRSSVTLVLADYVVMDNAEQFSYEYKYQTAKTDLTKYIVIDKIEVKCTKKATASE